MRKFMSSVKGMNCANFTRNMNKNHPSIVLLSEILYFYKQFEKVPYYDVTIGVIYINPPIRPRPQNSN